MISDPARAAFLVLALLCACSSDVPRRPLLASPGLPAPELRLPEIIQGPPPELRGWDDLGGRAAVLHFWAPRCPACPAELAGYNALSSEFSGRALAFVHITDAGRDQAARFLADRPVKGLVAPGAPPELFAAFRVYDLPCSVLVTASSEIFAFAGPGGVTRELITALLAGGPPPDEARGPEACRPPGVEK
ncbi:MAG: TlpA disulfide reductase family protein [Elusimicrobiales bacterium]|nr:TlpA disulfide reductase family protein [Elusimicrobiales bacterium]